MAASGLLWHALGICPGDVVLFTGGGDKFALALRAARELMADGRPPVFTCTTETLPVSGMTPLYLDDLGPAWPAAVAEEVGAGRAVCLGARLDAATGKVVPIAPEQVAGLKQVKGCVVLVVAGTSAGDPPASEPVIPPDADLVVPVAEDPVTPGVAAGALASAEGCIRSAAGARLVPVLIQADRDGADPALREAASRLLGQEAANGARIGRVVIAAPEAPDPVKAVIGNTAAIVLAGGASRRFGGNKLLHGWGGATVLEASLQAPLRAGLKEVVVVTGAYHEVLAPLLARYPVRVVPNPDWAEGMSTSVKAGLRSFAEEPDAAIICLGDMPFLPPGVLTELARVHARTGAPIVAPVVGGSRRNPVLFDRALFPLLMEVRGDEGGRAVVQRYQQEMVRVPFPEEDWFRDVDGPEDLNG